MPGSFRMVPVEGQSFSSEQDWINRAKRVLTSHPSYNNTEHAEATGWRGPHFTALCFDQAGRRMRNGGDFKRATDEATYPVWWVWPDQIAAMLTATPVREEGGAVDERLKWFLKVIEGAGGEVCSTENRHNPINVFCEDRDNGDDTFNISEAAGYTQTSHDTSFDTSTTRITDKGRAYLSALATREEAPAEEAELDAPDQERIERSLRTTRAYDAVRHLRDALSATTIRLTDYDWNVDPEGLTKQQGAAFAAADKVFADLTAAVATHPDWTDEEWDAAVASEEALSAAPGEAGE